MKINSIFLHYSVIPIKKEETYPWLLEKHYAKRIPPIMYAFGIYDSSQTLQGCCVFGYPCRMLTKHWGNILELTRLVINENLPKNSLSFLVSNSLKLLPKPIVVVSYADDNQGHHGYIYQATNWIYTGLSSSENKISINGQLIHRRILNSVYGTSSVQGLKNKGWDVDVEEQSGKHRYFMFLGSKKEKKEMAKKLHFGIFPYPKGDNQRYDASYEPTTQGVLPL